ncbi:oligosaccharide MFS transporter [Escherichia coli]|uniref:oligosaccharide MFS transporter n=1 Tax=Escherichia coli TaxID=562 RepID=UPI000A471356|nr:oligosaccharide MFS transporter [Escherichia coli]
MYYLKNTNFWMFGLFFFFYFFIMGAYFPFFPIWLHDINHISKSDTGIIFAAISLFSLLFQPLFGLLSDKLGLRKYLLWIITGMLVMFAPFFIFIFGPLLQYNILVGSIVGGIYLGFCFNAGAPAVEAFIEKVSRRSNFEFGRARMFGCVVLAGRCVPRLSASCSPSIISLFSGWVLAVHSSSPFCSFSPKRMHPLPPRLPMR